MSSLWRMVLLLYQFINVGLVCHVLASPCVVVRGHLERVSFLFPLYGFLGQEAWVIRLGSRCLHILNQPSAYFWSQENTFILHFWCCQSWKILLLCKYYCFLSFHCKYFMYVHSIIWSSILSVPSPTPPTALQTCALPIVHQLLIFFPFYLCSDNSLGLVSVAHMCMDVGPFTRAWAIYQCSRHHHKIWFFSSLFLILVIEAEFLYVSLAVLELTL